ncbi:MAG: glycogen synthase [Gemmatimonadetes bacterium]|nr:glycogen synthase [Gemmatimonadota bacterium]
MRILFVAAEVAPLVKTGGLADVAGALPAALQAAGHDVCVIMPFYQRLRAQGVAVLGPVAATFLPAGERMEECRVWRATDHPVPLYLLDIPAAFARPGIYGDGDDDRRFILFARGVLAAMQHRREVHGWIPDVVHANDWHAALVPHYCKTTLAYTFGRIGTVCTIHNLAYQGRFNPFTLALAGLTEGGLLENQWGPRVAGAFNFLARGLAASDVITTVSPTYAREIRTAEYGEGLEGLLLARQHRLVGILNGLDTRLFDPATDPHLAAPYDADAPAGKAACKAALQRELGWAEAPDRPLLGVVSRLVSQKGLDLLLDALPWLLRDTAAQLVVLGSGEHGLESAFHHAAAAHPGRLALRTGFDAALAQRIYAGTDLFLMPSRFEPCGLGQLIALRYGSVPVVRATGGLQDTVREGYEGNGFVFHPVDAGEFVGAIARALEAYRTPEGWAMLRARGMREDHGWARAAEGYGAVYRRAAAFAAG